MSTTMVLRSANGEIIEIGYPPVSSNAGKSLTKGDFPSFLNLPC